MNDVTLAIVGTRVLAHPGDVGRAVRHMEEAIRDLNPKCIITGGAQGIDLIAEAVAATFNYTIDDDLIVLKPAAQKWAAEGGYRERNIAIVDTCTHLLWLSCTSSSTYGSGWTAQQARKAGRQVTEITVCQ